MNENIKAFLEKVAEDPELQAKFSEVKDLDEAYAIACTVQEGFTKEEFLEEMTKVKNAMDENLTEEDMAKSAGGMSDEELATVLTGVSISVSTTVISGASAAAV